MKQILTTIFIMAIILLFSAHSRISAQGDTLVVYATPTPIDEVINNDTTSTGAQAHAVYKLVSLDTTYLYLGAITVNSDIEIYGQTDPADGRPPCIQPGVLPDNSIPANFITLTGANTRGTFKNLYLLGLSINGSANGGNVGIQASADNIAITVDNIVFEEWQNLALAYSGNYDKFFVTNCKFRNMVHPNQWYIGEALRNTWPGNVYTDTVVMKYNTFFCLNGYASAPVTKYYMTHFEFTNNNIIYTFKNPFFIFNVTSAKINNNIFYSAWAGGISREEYPWWDQLWSPEVGSLIDLDTLNKANAADFGVDTTDANWRWLAEAQRTIEVKNNAYFWPEVLTSFWESWNDTATVDSVYTATWMNERTTNMFTDKTHWPGLEESGNMNVDPGFGQSILDVLTQSPDGLLDWFRLCRTNSLSTTYWGYERTQVGANADWIPEWPLPESEAMQYTNAALRTAGTDGGLVGDPYWFKGSPTGINPEFTDVPLSFALFDAYPNPFNPVTTIKFRIPESGNVNLKIYDIMGKEVKTLINNVYTAQGEYNFAVDMSNLVSGIYFYTLQQNNNIQTKKMVLLK